jgi:acetyl-CoA acetyltransferase
VTRRSPANTSTLVAVTGVGDSDTLGKGQQNASWCKSAVRSATVALDDAGLTVDEIDGVLTWGENNWTLNPRRHLDLAQLLGIDVSRLAMSVATGGSSPCMSIEIARWAIRTDRCRNVLLCNGGGFEAEAEAAFDGGRLGAFLAQIPHHSVSFEQPYGPMISSYYAAAAMRHMYEFGTTSEQFAAVAVAFRKHASLNPRATFRDPITVDDVLSSRVVCSPLHMLDCGGGVRGNGGAALILSSREQARDLRRPPVWLLGVGLAASPYFMGALCRGDGEHDLVRTVVADAAKAAFGQAGVTPEDIDNVQLHDNFTSTVVIHIEDAGFCKKGEGGPFVQDGALEIGGRLPTNTDGGHMNFGPVPPARQVEGIRQLRGDVEPGRQVPNSRLSLTMATAGVMSTAGVAIFGRD